MEPTSPGQFLNNPGVQLLALLLATLGLSYLTNYWLSRIFVGKTYRYLVAPGVIIHEYSHALGCIITGARIKEVRVFDARGGRVVHEEPKVPFGEGIISMAPIVGAAIAVYILARILVPSFVGYGELQISSWQFLLFAYLSSSITATMAPSKQDLKVGAAGFGILCVLIGLASLSNWVATYIGFFTVDIYKALRYIILFSLSVLAVLGGTAGVVYYILHRTSRKGATYQSSVD